MPKVNITFTLTTTIEMTQDETTIFNSAGIYPAQDTHDYDNDGYIRFRYGTGGCDVYIMLMPGRIGVFKVRAGSGAHSEKKRFDFEELCECLSDSEVSNRLRNWIMSFDND